MTKFQISTKDTDTNVSDFCETDGFLLFYLQDDKILMKGRMELKALAPILTKIALDRMSR